MAFPNERRLLDLIPDALAGRPSGRFGRLDADDAEDASR